jgi:hypothetical protein
VITFTTNAERWQLIEMRLVPAALILAWLSDRSFRRFVANKLGAQPEAGT